MNQPTFIIAALLLILSGGCGATAPVDTECPKSNSPIDCHLEVTAVKNSTVAILKFSNRSKTPYPYLRWNLIMDGEVTFDAFDMKRNGTSVEYKGVRVKRRPTTKDDFEILEPMKEIKTQIILNHSYDLRDGKYALLYCALFPHLDDPSKLDVIRSNQVEFEIVHGSLKK